MIDLRLSWEQDITEPGGKGTATASVDVLVAARDRADTIERAVLSALAEKEVKTVIVVDDGSTDDTAARAQQCNPEGERVIVERLHSSFGPSTARNVAIDISTAPWLAILDADDFFLPGRIRALLSWSDDCDLVADGMLQIPEHHAARESLSTPAPDLAIQARRLTLQEFALGNVTRRGFDRKELGYLKPLLRRNFFDRHRLRYDPSLRLGEDCFLYARALASGARFLLIPAAGYVAIERADSLSARHGRQDLERLAERVRELTNIGHLTVNERQALAALYSDLGCRAQWLGLVEALKSHNYSRLMSAFSHSPTTTRYLIGRLIEEAPAQLRKRLQLPL